MQNWDDLKFCLALERYQTMTAAARALGTNTATVSRRIDRLTEEAGEPLFLRDNTQWRATDMGRELAQIALRIEDRISRAATETTEQQKTQILRINANEATLNAQLVQNIASFSENYHDLNLTLSSRQASLAYGETDIVLTHVAPTEGRIIRKKVGAYACGPTATPCWRHRQQDGLQRPTVWMKPLKYRIFLQNSGTCRNSRCIPWI